MGSYYWADQLANQLSHETAQVINDSKTPSGRIHIGALRGPLIHDLVYRACQSAGIPAAFMYGYDDFDPLDNIPPYLKYEEYQPYLGKPLRYVPSPNPKLSYADFFIGELFA